MSYSLVRRSSHAQACAIVSSVCGTALILMWCAILRTRRAGPDGGPASLMLLGLDVTHPTGAVRQTDENERRKRPEAPSVSSVVASINA